MEAEEGWKILRDIRAREDSKEVRKVVESMEQYFWCWQMLILLVSVLQLYLLLCSILQKN